MAFNGSHGMPWLPWKWSPLDTYGSNPPVNVVGQWEPCWVDPRVRRLRIRGFRVEGPAGAELAGAEIASAEDIAGAVAIASVGVNIKAIIMYHNCYA